MTRALVTGGLGFIGSALVRRLLDEGHDVRVLDNVTRGDPRRLADIVADVDIRSGDIRDAGAVRAASEGIDVIWHLAAVNGTSNFYRYPALVLEVGIRGMLNVLDAVRDHRVDQLFVASSSEVYASPAVIPTDELVPMTVPEPLNPRYSYAGSKIASELLALNAGRDDIGRVVVFRPHNIYGPDMGWEHVIPQLVLKARALMPAAEMRISVQGTGRETRAFCHVDDLVDGLMLLFARATHLGIYNVGTEEEVTIASLAARIARHFGSDVQVVPGPEATGGTKRRCPDVSRIRALGYEPRVPLSQGLPATVRWYDEHAGEAPAAVIAEIAGASE